MKANLVAIALLLTAFFQARAQAASGNCALNVHITGLRNQKGKAAAVVFTSSKGWPEDEADAFDSDEVSIVGSRATISFRLPPGKYAVAALDDENENQKLDRNFLGIPTEGFGFANNPKVFLSAPSFNAAEITVACPATNIHIKMIYK